MDDGLLRTMKKAYIKQTLSNVAVLLTALLVCVSCIKDNETETAPECAILSFSVNSITSSVLTKKYDREGNASDTLVSKTILGSDIYFNIDQVNGRIYNVDSLPNWTDLTRVVPNFSSRGTVFGRVVSGDDLYYRLVSGSDSIDFSKPVELMCISTDGQASRFYTVKINKHMAATDTLEWKTTSSNLSISGSSKVHVTDGEVFVFASNGNGDQVVTFANENDATTWSAPATIPVDGGSVVMFNSQFYGLGTDGYIYSASPDQLDTWTKASDKPMKRLLAADDYFLYAYDGQAIIGTSDLQTWTVQGTTDLDMLPETSVCAYSHASNTNSKLQVAVMTGLSSNNPDHGVAWYKVTSSDSTINQPWAYIQVTLDNPYGLPHLGNLSTTYYNGAFYAIGTSDADKYEYLYRSDDNGITWHQLTGKYPMPANLNAANGATSIATVGTMLWMIQENGQIWQGSIR